MIPTFSQFSAMNDKLEMSKKHAKYIAENIDVNNINVDNFLNIPVSKLTIEAPILDLGAERLMAITEADSAKNKILENEYLMEKLEDEIENYCFRNNDEITLTTQDFTRDELEMIIQANTRMVNENDAKISGYNRKNLIKCGLYFLTAAITGFTSYFLIVIPSLALSLYHFYKLVSFDIDKYDKPNLIIVKGLFLPQSKHTDSDIDLTYRIKSDMRKGERNLIWE